jgi:poly-beta-1,6-N-acetyl-D-glucosamine synthase
MPAPVTRQRLATVLTGLGAGASVPGLYPALGGPLPYLLLACGVTKLMNVSVAVPAYSEERNIGLLIDSLRQQTSRADIVEIVVVASGCTDGTVDVVRDRMSRPGVPVRLIVEPKRSGKVAAINTYFRHQPDKRPKIDAICVCSADLLVTPDAIERLAWPLVQHREVGMSGAHPMPTNGHGTFLGEAIRFLWSMHHRVALERPKLGEMVMVRAGIVRALPSDCAVDEASLEHLITRAGYQLAYVPEAVVHNHGPETLVEFVRQRRRIAAGHYWLRDVSGYEVATLNLARIARHTLSELANRREPRLFACAVGTVGLEVLSRGLGYLDFRTNKSHAVWEVSETTKAVMTDEIRSLYREPEPPAQAEPPRAPTASAAGR